MTRKCRDFEELLDEYLEDPQYAADYLSEALQYDNMESFLMSLRDIIRVHGSVAAVAGQADISPSTLYNLLSAASNPSVRTLMSVLHAVGCDLAVTPRLQKARG